MAPPSSVPRLTDIIEAIELIRSEMAGVTLEALEPDRRKRWLVERGIEIISEANRRLSDELKARHPEIPWPKGAGIGNVLRHEYEHVAHDVLWHVVRDDLPALARHPLLASMARDATELQLRLRRCEPGDDRHHGLIGPYRRGLRDGAVERRSDDGLMDEWLSG